MATLLAFLADLSVSFTLGLLTPLTAVCVLPLYPAFLTYLSNQMKNVEEKSKLPIIFGLLVSAGAILFMTLLGLVFTTILQVSLTNVIGVISPIAFGILFVISILLILDYDIGQFLPQKQVGRKGNPFVSAFLYGFFFGAIVVPCNPLFIAALFTKTLLVVDFIQNFLNFVAFGVGISFPLLVFSAISSARSKSIIGFLIKHKRRINLATGSIMLVISVYYLLFVFKIFKGII
ncbi:cytochrome c-type biogenesis protein [Methanohalophilus levihalophilus]|uniref:cytochrome c biogenesis CcdA family protein n=1 Tax=Methanohalophilus levihalophilus TaxID=1431282 RepID=UPI001AEB0939|nr:cytochrome c biogenesis protein CcdA [Methanohalophilus levihalophilus]MBP2029904.1 cytochrome c-type biogenesis protein [Methanohalophilus levihalophilus]